VTADFRNDGFYTRGARQWREAADGGRRQRAPRGEDDGGGPTAYCRREAADSDRHDLNGEKKAAAAIGASGAVADLVLTVVELMVVVA
jgi:hypothetical protein